MRSNPTLVALLIAASTSAALAASAIPDAPELAKKGKYQTNEEAVVLPVSLAEAWAFWQETSITDFLEPTDRIPAIEGFELLEGPAWGVPGAVRRVTFVGGGSALERVLTSDEDEFTYQIWNIETASGRFIDHIYGEFRAEPTEAGTQITWRYNVKPALFAARPAIRSFLRNDFDPFMEGGMAGMVAAFDRQVRE